MTTATRGVGQTATGADGFVGQPNAGRAPPKPEEPVVVSVVGLVHTPGLVTLNPGARIADALSAAGGALDGADLIGLNMARRVTDGEQIIVGIAGPPGEPAAMGSSIAAEPGPPDRGCAVGQWKCLGARRFGGSEHRDR